MKRSCMKQLFSLLIVVLIAGCSGPSQEEIDMMSEACREFISDNMTTSLRNTQVFENWNKNGVVVFEIGYKNSRFDTSYTVRKCVYDEKNGTISSPSPLNDSEWAK